MAAGASTLSCQSELSESKGGLRPWSVEGTWEWDASEEEVIMTITKDDPRGGPKVDRDLELPVLGDTLTYRNIECTWARPPRDHVAEKLEAMPLKELKAVALASGQDPTGCIERTDFMRLLSRARACGTLDLNPRPVSESTSLSPPASPGKGSVARSSPATSPAKELPAPTTPAAEAVPAAAEEPVPAAAPAPAAEPAAPAQLAEQPPSAEVTDVQPEVGTFTLEQLTDRRLWENLGVKASERETYLPGAIFEKLFGMQKQEFAKLPKWKRDNLKRKHDLF